MRPKKIILCVHRDEIALGVRKFMLETRGYRVIGAVGAQQAIDAFNAQLPDLVLTELVLPEIDGNDLVRRLKDIAPCVPMVIASSLTQTLATHRADAFFVKDTSTAELLERIRIFLIRKRGPKKYSERFDAPIQLARTA